MYTLPAPAPASTLHSPGAMATEAELTPDLATAGATGPLPSQGGIYPYALCKTCSADPAETYMLQPLNFTEPLGEVYEIRSMVRSVLCNVDRRPFWSQFSGGGGDVFCVLSQVYMITNVSLYLSGQPTQNAAPRC